ncbi:MAG: hypothetical protein IPN17_08505 [Deltaproteobacteria bacterium]|nr:hypothetical protein [Deltaproteobacteria bacterium]
MKAAPPWVGELAWLPSRHISWPWNCVRRRKKPPATGSKLQDCPETFWQRSMKAAPPWTGELAWLPSRHSPAPRNAFWSLYQRPAMGIPACAGCAGADALNSIASRPTGTTESTTTERFMNGLLE